MDTKNDPQPLEPAEDTLAVDAKVAETTTTAEAADKQPKPLDVLPNIQPRRTANNSSRRLLALAGLFIVTVIGLSLFMILRA